MKYYFHNYIFRKFEIVACFAPLLHGVERNTFFNFDSISDSLKSKTWNSWKRMHCNEKARRIHGKRNESFSHARVTRKEKWQRAPSSLPTRFTTTGRLRVWDTASVSDLGSLKSTAPQKRGSCSSTEGTQHTQMYPVRREKFRKISISRLKWKNENYLIFLNVLIFHRKKCPTKE